MTATPVVKDSAAVATAGEFVWHVVKFSGSGSTSVELISGSCILRAASVNTVLNANDLFFANTTGNKIKLPASSAVTTQPIFLGDGLFDKLILNHAAALTGEVSLLIKEF